MTEVPKIVHHRLRAGGQAAAGTHPEADMLTAFAEQALSQAEREGVLTHLAACGDCREVVLLALPEVVDLPKFEPESEPEQVLVPIRTRRNWFGWGNLRWAALAAGIAVAVMIVRPGMQNQSNQTPAVTAVAKPPVSPTTAQPASSAVISESKAERGIDAAPKEANELGRSTARDKQANAPAPSNEPAVGFMVANNLKKDAGRLDKPVAASAPVTSSLDQPRSMSEVVAVTAASGAVAAPAASDRLMAKLEAPAIEKAKPARDEEVGAKEQKLAAPASRARVAAQASNDAAFARPYTTSAAGLLDADAKMIALWKVADGTLQRSSDGGQSWQNALKANHPLLCWTTQKADVWAGGQAGTLSHSKDDGATWETVEVSSQGQALKSDIMRVEIRGPAEVVLTTADHQIWRTNDSGKTWETK